MLTAIVVVAFGAGAAYLASLPGVGDAGERTDRILAAHGGTPDAPPPPAKLGAAVVAAEDSRFYTNFAVEILIGAGRAAVAALHTSQDPGGSTIAQQLAKQLYGHANSLSATLREIGLGIELDLRYSKPEILVMYLNAVYYGHGYYGDVAASRGYFGLSPRDLDWAQAALLAGLPQAPTADDPTEHLALAKARQRYVLDQLVATGRLTGAQANRVYAEPLGLR